MDHIIEAQRALGLVPSTEDTLSLASNQTILLAAIANALVSIAQSLDKITGGLGLVDNDRDALRVVSVQ